MLEHWILGSHLGQDLEFGERAGFIYGSRLLFSWAFSWFLGFSWSPSDCARETGGMVMWAMALISWVMVVIVLLRFLLLSVS